jgi:hypothetical protein
VTRQDKTKDPERNGSQHFPNVICVLLFVCAVSGVARCSYLYMTQCWDSSVAVECRGQTAASLRRRRLTPNLEESCVVLLENSTRSNRYELDQMLRPVSARTLREPELGHGSVLHGATPHHNRISASAPRAPRPLFRPALVLVELLSPKRSYCTHTHTQINFFIN